MQDQQDMVVRILSTVAGPAVPPVYKLFMAPWPWAPFLTALFTPPFFKVWGRQRNRPDQTRLPALPRFLFPPCFSLPRSFR